MNYLPLMLASLITISCAFGMSNNELEKFETSLRTVFGCQKTHGSELPPTVRHRLLSSAQKEVAITLPTDMQANGNDDDEDSKQDRRPWYTRCCRALCNKPTNEIVPHVATSCTGILCTASFVLCSHLWWANLSTCK